MEHVLHEDRCLIECQILKEERGGGTLDKKHSVIKARRDKKKKGDKIIEYDCRPVQQALTLMSITHSVLNQIERAGSDEKKMEHSGRQGQKQFGHSDIFYTMSQTAEFRLF